ncbi:MAG: tetratricopeptide repeat protein, partial [Lysobacteraceae bacterium]
MKPLAGNVVVGTAVVLALFAGWRVVGQMQAERYARTDPERALQWRPNDPQALLTLAERALDEGDLDAAERHARRLLAVEPLWGQAFGVIAEARDRQGHRPEAFALYRIAAHRAPRDMRARAWLTQRYLETGQYPEALVQVDRILRLYPDSAATINPVLVQMAQAPAFAAALAKALQADPPWRTRLLASFNSPKTGNPVAAGQVMQALQDQGALDDAEYSRWLDSLLAQGRWGEAYARWAGPVAARGGVVPILYNGDFSVAPSNTGFDWRIRRVPGVLVEFGEEPGANGPAAHLQFLGRRIPNAGLEQPLMLSAGRYTLSTRTKARGLQTAMGLQWQVSCAGTGAVVMRSEPVDGSFGWKQD